MYNTKLMKMMNKTFKVVCVKSIQLFYLNSSSFAYLLFVENMI